MNIDVRLFVLLSSLAGCYDRQEPSESSERDLDEQTQSELCANGVDDDVNGLVDCEDLACFDVEECVETDCRYGDSDGDGLVGCADPDCWGVPPCHLEWTASGRYTAVRRMNGLAEMFNGDVRPYGRQTGSTYLVVENLRVSVNDRATGESCVWTAKALRGRLPYFRSYPDLTLEGIVSAAPCEQPESWAFPSAFRHHGAGPRWMLAGVWDNGGAAIWLVGSGVRIGSRSEYADRGTGFLDRDYTSTFTGFVRAR